MMRLVAALIALAGWGTMLTQQPHEWTGLAIFLIGAGMFIGTFIERTEP